MHKNDVAVSRSKEAFPKKKRTKGRQMSKANP